MSLRRVAITGIGVVSSIGRDRAAFADAMRHGRSGIAPLSGYPAGTFRFANGAEVRDWTESDYFDSRTSQALDRTAQFAVVAAHEAVRDAGIAAPAGERAAVVTGCCVGGQGTSDAEFAQLYGDRVVRVHPLSIPRVMANSGASAIATEFGIEGPAWTVSTACSSANHAIGQALHLLRGGGVDLAIAGGHEAVFSYGFLRSWEALRVVSPDTCRPFSKDRKGMILGEGAAMLVLEDLDAARARGAHVYAELAGFGMSADAHHITQPSAEGAARAMRMAVSDAGLRPEQIGYVNAHGTGTPLNDATETQSIRLALGSAAERVAVSSTKSLHGHALGAAGALEAAATALALHVGWLPPTANYSEPDPQCDLDIVTGAARDAEVEAALSNSFAFGGLNAVLAFRSVRR